MSAIRDERVVRMRRAARGQTTLVPTDTTRPGRRMVLDRRGVAHWVLGSARL